MSSKRSGKPSADQLAALIGQNFGAPSKELIVGPGPGLDAAIIDLQDGRIMAIAEDPIFPAPGLPLDLMGWFTVHIGASDVAVTGVRPRYMTYTLLLPPTCPDSDARTIITSISDAARELGITIAGGHTGWYDAVSIPTVGGVTVWGFANHPNWVSPGGARDGDTILMTKGPAIEAVALLSVIYQDKLRATIDSKLVDQMIARTSQITVVDDALTAFASGGVHAMHDATEGGVFGGVVEMASAASLPVAINTSNIPVAPDITACASALEFNPWHAISEGTLLAAVAPENVAKVCAALSDKNIESFILGHFDASLPYSTITHNNVTNQLLPPASDPFWQIFFAGLTT